MLADYYRRRESENAAVIGRIGDLIWRSEFAPAGRADAAAMIAIGGPDTQAAPITNDDTASGGENALTAIDVLANDVGAGLSLVSTSITSGEGSVSIGGGKVRYDPGSRYDYLAAGQTAEVSIQYVVTDRTG